MKYWTEKEIGFLKKNWGVMEYKELSKILDRTPHSIGDKLYNLGLTKFKDFTKQKRKIIMKNLVKNKKPEWEKKRINALKSKWKNDIEWKEKMCNISKESIKKSHITIKSNPKYKEIKSKVMTALNKDRDFRLKCSEANIWKTKGVEEQERIKKLISTKSKEKWLNSEYRKKQLKNRKEEWEREGFRENQSKKRKEQYKKMGHLLREGNKKIWTEPKYEKIRKKIFNNLTNHPKNFKTYYGFNVRSKGEQSIANFLYKYGIIVEYEKNIPNSNYLTDFFLPQYDKWVEYFGMNNSKICGERYNKKIKFYADNNLKLIKIYPNQFYELKDIFSEVINGTNST